MLQKAFDESSRIYKERGFQRRIGFGKKPAIISVDLANAWTRPGNPFSSDMKKMDEEIIPGMQRLLEAARKNGHVVVHVTTAYQNTDRNDPHTDMGRWHNKIPVEAVSLKDTHWWAIDDRIKPLDNEWVMLKKRVPSRRSRARRSPDTCARAASTPSWSLASRRLPACAPRSVTASRMASAPSR
jgi:N-carbamoylsarcosine amidase